MQAVGRRWWLVLLGWRLGARDGCRGLPCRLCCCAEGQPRPCQLLLLLLVVSCRWAVCGLSRLPLTTSTTIITMACSIGISTRRDCCSRSRSSSQGSLLGAWSTWLLVRLHGMQLACVLLLLLLVLRQLPPALLGGSCFLLLCVLLPLLDLLLLGVMQLLLCRAWLTLMLLLLPPLICCLLLAPGCFQLACLSAWRVCSPTLLLLLLQLLLFARGGRLASGLPCLLLLLLSPDLLLHSMVNQRIKVIRCCRCRTHASTNSSRQRLLQLCNSSSSCFGSKCWCSWWCSNPGTACSSMCRLPAA